MNALRKKDAAFRDNVGVLYFVAMDKEFRCLKGNQNFQGSFETGNNSSRSTGSHLHILLDGFIRIIDQHNVCSCGTTVPYDGLTDGLFPR